MEGYPHSNAAQSALNIADCWQLPPTFPRLFLSIEAQQPIFLQAKAATPAHPLLLLPSFHMAD